MPVAMSTIGGPVRTGCSVRKAVQRHEAAFGLCDRIEARAQGERPLAAIGGDRAIDQPRIGRRDRRIVEAELLHHAAGKILHHYVGFRDQFARNLQRRRVGEVERDAALVAVEAEKGRALAADFRMFIVARIVAAIGIFDLDDLGAEIGQRLRTGGPRNNTGEIDDQQTVEGGRLALRARRAFRQLRSGGHVGHFLVLFCLAEQIAAAAKVFQGFYRKPIGNAKPRICRAGPASHIALSQKANAARSRTTGIERRHFTRRLHFASFPLWKAHSLIRERLDRNHPTRRESPSVWAAVTHRQHGLGIIDVHARREAERRERRREDVDQT